MYKNIVITVSQVLRGSTSISEDGCKIRIKIRTDTDHKERTWKIQTKLYHPRRRSKKNKKQKKIEMGEEGHHIFNEDTCEKRPSRV